MRKRWWLILLVLVLAIPLGLLLRNFARDVLLMELLRIVWAGRILFESLPQLPLWIVFLFAGLIVAVRSLVGRAGPGPQPSDEERQHRGQIAVLARRIRRSAESDYYQWHLARHLRALVLETLAYEHRLTTEEIRQRLDSGAIDVPPEVQAYLHAGLAPIYTQSSGLLGRLRHRLASSVQSTHIDPDLFRVVEFLETQLEDAYRPETGARQTTALQSGTGQPLEVLYDR